jgi:branched-chain amino acid transport system ATP-binding protein
MSLVKTERLTKAFGALTAVDGVSIEVQEGSLHSVIGPNGAGKTTFFNLLTGQLAPTSGRIIFDGRDIAGTPPHRVARLGIARSFQRTSIFPSLTIADNVWLAAFARQESWRGLAWRRADRYPALAERARAVLGEVGLAGKADQPAREISHGEQRQLELAIALAAAPRLLLLDEPAAGLVPGRDPEDGRARARAQGALHHRPHRAQDRRRHDHVRPDFRHALRQPDRGGHPHGDPAERRGPAGLPGRRRRAMILEISGIDTYYGLGHILHGLSLAVAEGEVVALLGRNGAGKTTTLRSISGLTPPRRGTIVYKGASIAGLPAHRISRLGIALVPETRGIFSYLTARENLEIARRPGTRWPMEKMLERFPKLREVLDRKGRFLSGGEQQMLAIARALLTGPELLLLDEPSQGLAPLVVEAVMGTIRELKDERVSMLLVEQNAEMALRLADRVYVIDHGTIVFEGTPDALRADHQVTATYLGVGG